MMTTLTGMVGINANRGGTRMRTEEYLIGWFSCFFAFVWCYHQTKFGKPDRVWNNKDAESKTSANEGNY